MDSINTILVPISSGQTGGNVIIPALHLGKVFDARVVALSMRRQIAKELAQYKWDVSQKLLQPIIDRVERECHKESAKAALRFDTYCQAMGVLQVSANSPECGFSASWQEQLGSPRDLLPLIGKFMDIIVVTKVDSNTNFDEKASACEALFNTGRSVIIMPPEYMGTTGENILIAWKRSAEAARAVSAAIPFLTRFCKVTILSVAEGLDHDPSATELAQHLKRHAVEADINWIMDEDRPPEQIVMDKAQEIGADLIICGAYSYYRSCRRILGQFTRYMTEKADIPVLMSS